MKNDTNSRSTCIAVLPFENLSGDSDHDYFATEFVEDLITDLSRFHSLQVISSYTSKKMGAGSPDGLAEAKARSVAGHFNSSVIIGSDQVACIDGRILGKPGNHGRAVEQLRFASGRQVDFFTGLSLLDASDGTATTICEPFKVHFRHLGIDQIEHYVERETPFNCAGSFKSEGLGIALFKRLEGDDPNALVGLPLIRLVDLLKSVGISVL